MEEESVTEWDARRRTGMTKADVYKVCRKEGECRVSTETVQVSVNE